MPPSKSSQKKLIAKAKKGDPAAWEELLEKAHPMMRSAISKILRNHINEIEDVTAAAVLKVYSKIKTFRGDSSFSTWAHQVAVREALMFLRHKRHKPDPLSLDYVESEHGDDVQFLRADVSAEDARLRSVPLKVDLHRAVEELPPVSRLFVTLHDLHSLEHKYIAELLGCAIGTSKCNVHRGRALLRKRLDPRRAAEFEFENKKLSNGLRTM